jgi:hypothetical protein
MQGVGSAANDKPALVVIFEVVGCVVFGAATGILATFNHKISALWCFWVVVLSACGLLSHYFDSSKPNWKKWVRAIFIIILLGVSAVFSKISYSDFHSGFPIERQIIYHSVIARAHQWQPPELPPNIPRTGGKVMVQLTLAGNLEESFPAVSEQDEEGPNGKPITIDGDGLIVFPYEKNNRIYVKSQTMFGDKNETVLMNNEWPANIPVGWDRNFNGNSFELVDNTMLPVLQVRYDSANVIQVNGVFVSPTGGISIAFNGLWTMPRPSEKELSLANLKERKAWFKYPSTNHLGERAD